MKTRAWILTVSLLLNGGLAAAFLVDRPSGDGRVSLDRGSMGAGDATSSHASNNAAVHAAAGGATERTVDSAGRPTLAPDLHALAGLFRSGNGEELARVLRAAGVPEDLVRALVREQIQAGYRARMRAITDQARGDRPWWQTGGRFELTAEQRGELRELQRAMRAEVERVLGPDEGPSNRTGNYAFLPADKAEAARQIEADYAEMSRELRDKMEDFRLPSDRDALRLLEEERRADVAALLSPAELHELDLRTSQLSNRLRRELGSVVASEEEFRAIYDLAASYEAQYGREATNQAFSRSDRGAAESALRQEIMDMLGPERTAVLARQRDPDYRTMQAATARLNLPATAIDSVMTARAAAAAESQRIAADTTLDAAARRAALGVIANQVRTQLRTTMGQDGAEAFAQRARWLRELERGRAFTVRPEGGVSIDRGGDDD